MNYVVMLQKFPHVLGKLINWISSLSIDDISNLMKADLRIHFLNHYGIGVSIEDYFELTGQIFFHYQITDPEISRYLEKAEIDDFGCIENGREEGCMKVFEILERYLSEYEN